MSEPNLRVQVIDDNIVVTLPGYSYSVAYYKPEGSPGLLVRYSVAKNDLRLSMDWCSIPGESMEARQR
jgi:hypothetical protein